MREIILQYPIVGTGKKQYTKYMVSIVQRMEDVGDVD